MFWFILLFLCGCRGALTACDSYKSESSSSEYKSAKKPECIMGTEPVCGTNGFENFLFENQCELNDFNGRQLRDGQFGKLDSEVKFLDGQNYGQICDNMKSERIWILS